ncbi:MAG: chitooligosaccharide deacetylase [Clostridiales bacterium]|nr:MAG: chitooligosaccharide deacetylase [Clostridiales bacterium]
MKKFLCLALTLFFTTSAFPSHAAGSVWNPEDGVVLSGSPDSKKIALTFDDGPHPSKTNKILDLLKEYSIHATFFVIGQNVAAYPDVVLREMEEGHEIGNHTYHHKSLYRCKKETVEEEIISTEEILIDKTGCVPRVFRPPEGAYTCDILDVAGRMNYDVILWTIDTRDWAKASTDKIVETVLGKVKNGSIILMHDYTVNGTHTLDALKILIPKLLDMGYEFVTVSELIQ